MELDDGAVMHKLIKVPKKDVAQWDEEHDVTGRAVNHQPYAEEQFQPKVTKEKM